MTRRIADARTFSWQPITRARLITTVLGLLVAFALFMNQAGLAQAPERPGAGVTVHPAVDTSIASMPYDAVVRLLLEELGYEVEPAVQLANPIFYESVAQGDVDYWANGWFPLQRPQLPEDFESRASIVGAILEAGALQGYMVDRASAERYGITSLEDFKRPEVKEAFDADGDGRADLVACPPGWGCELVIEHHLDVYDLRDHVNDLKGTYAPAFADLLARYRNDEPVFFYTWTPNFTILELEPGEDVVWINVPEIVPSEAQEGYEEAMVLEDVDGAVTDPIRLGFVANDVSIVANDAFLEANPAAHRLFELIEMSIEEISEMTARVQEGEDDPESLEAMASAWVADHEAQVTSWLEEAREAAR